jgi:hypothetical protein
MASRLAAAQSTAEVCRETQKVLDQYQREKKEIDRGAWAIRNKGDAERYMANLNQAIAGGFVAANLNYLAEVMLLETPPPTKNERMEFQRAARLVLQGTMAATARTTLDDLYARNERILNQMDIRQRRLKNLKCDEVLAREQSSSENGLSVVGTWTWAFAEKGDPEKHGTVTFNADPTDSDKGTMDWSGGSHGTWTQSGVTVELHWDKKITDTMTLIEGGKKLKGTNTKGWTVIGTRQ